jgi:type I restriction enzyme S subunit
MRDGWLETNLGKYIQINTGKLDVNAASEFGEYPFFTCSRETYRIDEAAFEGESVLVAGNGDLNVKYYDGKFNAYQRTYVLNSIDRNILANRFLFLYMQTYIEYLRSETRGTVIQYLKKGQFTDAKIKLPPLPEQKRIVDLISSVDSYVEALQQQLESTKRSRDAIMHGLLTAVADDWVELSLGELTEHTRPICYGVLKPGPQVDGGVPLVKITDMDRRLLGPQGMQRISSELDNEFRRSRLKGGEVLLSIQGTVGRVAIADSTLTGANISRTIAVIEPDDRLLNLYLVYLLEKIARDGGFYSAGSTRESLNISTIRNMKIYCPPVIEQKRIIEIIDTLDRIVAKTENAIVVGRNLRSGLLSDLLSGEHEIPTGYDKVIGAAR